jgi:adenylylsulfate kinase-like enzyme
MTLSGTQVRAMLAAGQLPPMLAERGHRVELLDGDEVRTNSISWPSTGVGVWPGM